MKLCHIHAAILALIVYVGSGASLLHGNTLQAGGVAWADSALVTFNFAGYSTYLLRSEPAGTVNQSAAVAPGTVVTTPNLSANVTFGYWTLDGVRQQDAWGVAYGQFSFTMGVTDREAVAYLFAGDSDDDGVPDAYEQRYFGTLANDADSDSDGDGITLLGEYTGGTNPRHGNSSQSGGVAWSDSALVTVNLEDFSRYTLRSEPVGTVDQTAVVVPGTEVVTPDLSANASFGFWTLDGVRQENEWGVAHPQISFTVNATDREAVAYLFTGDSDVDGVPDAFEQRYFGTLENDADSDTDSDGVNLLNEYSNGTHPLFGDSHQAGGVVWADSEMVGVEHQPEIGVEQPTGTGLSNGGSRDFGSIAVGSSGSLSFTVRNHGGSELTGLTLTKSGTDASEFAVISNPTAPLLHHGNTTFTIRFSPGSAGVKSVVFQLASNDSDENPFDLNLTGTGVVLTGYETWQHSYFSPTELADSAISGPLVVRTADGLTNLVKYALGLNPTIAISSGLPEITTTSTDWVYTYTRPVTSDDITYSVEISTDLSAWTEAGVVHEKVSTVGDIETWQATYPFSSGDNVFFRLKVEQP